MRTHACACGFVALRDEASALALLRIGRRIHGPGTGPGRLQAA
ncbi:MAG TPA: hypothetical protein P5256_00485 [Beijerinckiaceae bacterium]|nr:hypothetical protein [Methylobacteriaceae bacterium]HRY01573.1 hypothetical protein [Beijerinckiaceae bacterium]